LDAIILELQAGRQEKYESHLIRNRKGSLPVQVNCRRVKLQTSEVIQWIIRDISERKDLDALRNDLAAMIYHDLRSPLSNIISSLDILESMLPMDTSPSLKSVFQITNRSAERLQRLTSSLLDINRLESGQTLTNLKTVNILEIALDAIDAVGPTFESRQQTFTTYFPKALPMLHVDVDMIRRVMINLLENGSKFTPFKGEINMGAKSEKGMVHIWVKDNGVGIPPEWQKVIFEKFTRLHSENAPKGVGLGLAFCRLAVRAHGGEKWQQIYLYPACKDGKALIRRSIHAGNFAPRLY
jgi:K+-sensing histidine kinase KdpD